MIMGVGDSFESSKMTLGTPKEEQKSTIIRVSGKIISIIITLTRISINFITCTWRRDE
jgi:hypothetical protein